MKKIQSILSRYRLLTSVLALALVLGALAAPPVPAQDMLIVDPLLCGAGCVNWVDGQGCLDCMHCCTLGSGDYWCWQDHAKIC